MRTDVVTCRRTDRALDVLQKIRAADQNRAVVIADSRAVLGLVAERFLEAAAPRALVEDIMDPGPATWRPSKLLQDGLERMLHHDVDQVLVTSPDGVLLGMLHRHDAERAVQAPRSSASAGRT